MPTLIKDGQVENNRWTLLKEATGPEVLQAVPGRNFLVPLDFWRLYPQELSEYPGQIAIWLDSDEQVQALAELLPELPLVALNFPVFSDGRSYTNARELRERFDYKGEVRAIGDVLRDQLFYMKRCGFNSFELRFDQDVEECLAAFSDFSDAYQPAIDQPEPLYRRR